MDVTRAVEPDLAPAFPAVMVLEGARTIGKTHTARKLVRSGAYQGYESLADTATLRRAKHDLPAWLASLPQTVVIDEAQLIDELPLQIKWLVDQPDSRRRFLLTGSARIGRSGLGGSDPLTGRVIRHTLAPLTPGEIAGDPLRTRTLVERMFTHEIIDAECPDEPVDIVGRIMAGGFPLPALNQWPGKDVDRWARGMVLGLLTDSVLPGERFDTATALRVLDGLLRNPGGIVNVASLGQRIGVVPRTIERYLDVLERRFLLHFLPNLATNAVRQTRARAKAHPVDTVFAVESLRRADPDALSRPETIGALFETYVVNQVVAGAQFYPGIVQSFYWRDAKMSAEVDLVLADSEGRRVGVEVKSASRVWLDDAAGLRACDRSLGLSAGYVVYAGTTVERLADRCWAIPVGML
jgi:predicted AAA+ superfamily ATPase